MPASPSALTEVEVTLTELGEMLEQRFDPYLEPIATASGEVVTSSSSAADAALGIRLCYRLEYDEASGVGEHWVDYPSLSDPTVDDYVRVSRQDREALPFISLDRAAALQLRSDGKFRALVDDASAADLSSALVTLGADVLQATEAFSNTPAIREQLMATEQRVYGCLSFCLEDAVYRAAGR